MLDKYTCLFGNASRHCRVSTVQRYSFNTAISDYHSLISLNSVQNSRDLPETKEELVKMAKRKNKLAPFSILCNKPDL